MVGVDVGTDVGAAVLVKGERVAASDGLVGIERVVALLKSRECLFLFRKASEPVLGTGFFTPLGAGSFEFSFMKIVLLSCQLVKEKIAKHFYERLGLLLLLDRG